MDPKRIFEPAVAEALPEASWNRGWEEGNRHEGEMMEPEVARKEAPVLPVLTELLQSLHDQEASEEEVLGLDASIDASGGRLAPDAACGCQVGAQEEEEKVASLEEASLMHPHRVARRMLASI